MDVIGIGALNVDRLYFVSSIARGGEEVSVYSETVAPGGSAANTIVALSRLGLRTGFVGMIGTDEDSKLVLEDLKKEKVDTQKVLDFLLKNQIIANVLETYRGDVRIRFLPQLIIGEKEISFFLSVLDKLRSEVLKKSIKY